MMTMNKRAKTSRFHTISDALAANRLGVPAPGTATAPTQPPKGCTTEACPFKCNSRQDAVVSTQVSKTHAGDASTFHRHTCPNALGPTGSLLYRDVLGTRPGAKSYTFSLHALNGRTPADNTVLRDIMERPAGDTAARNGPGDLGALQSCMGDSAAATIAGSAKLGSYFNGNSVQVTGVEMYGGATVCACARACACVSCVRACVLLLLLLVLQQGKSTAIVRRTDLSSLLGLPFCAVLLLR